MNFRSAAVACALAASLAGGAVLAQSDPMAMARQASANQLGLMEYCQSQGYADTDAVAASRTSLGRLPPAGAGAPPTDAAEALGRKGTLAVNGTETTLASMASSHNTTVGAMCGQMANSAKQAVAMSQAMPSMPAMPGGMPAMPSMPGGMPSGMPGGMPSMPGGMPAMPGTAAPSAAPR